MPAPFKNAVCGPQVPGTQKPENISSPGALASLNICPLNGQSLFDQVWMAAWLASPQC